MKAVVKKPVAEVNISAAKGGGGGGGGKGSSSVSFPDASELAQKYNVSEEREEEAGRKEGSAEFERNMSLQLEFAQKQQVLVQKLDAKNREVERLCVLLEAIDPIPGMDAEKLKRILDNPDNDVVDFRDSKIVALAKKCRKLQLAVTKERTQNETLATRLDDQKRATEQLQKELETSLFAQHAPPAANRVIRAESKREVEAAQTETSLVQLQKEMALANKTIEDLKKKLSTSVEENKSLSRALARELGEGVTLEQAMEGGGWRGRSQQIILLKAKIKRLEAGGSSGFKTKNNGVDVDAQAESELAGMSNERRLAMEAVTEDRTRIYEEYQQLEIKMQGQKARVRTLEGEAQMHKQQIKIVLEKSETDDQLIQEMRKEIERLKEKQHAYDRREEAFEQKMAAAVKKAQSQVVTATSAEQSEILRLRRLTKQQADQLSTQDSVIRSLREKGR